MTTLFAAPSEFDLPGLVSSLRPYNLDLLTGTYSTKESLSNLPTSIDRAVLIFPHQGILAVGERISVLRQALNPRTILWACIPQVTPSDREDVIRCGASLILTPSNWNANAVADRIQAEFIIAGDIRPRSFGGLLGATYVMRDLYRKIETIAPLSESILILGETGTGKELVAEQIHKLSGRSGSLMKVNCATLSAELLESELFGHERGAFSGAVDSRKGLLLEAGAGTILLDEIGDLAPSSQAKLLRVLEDWTVRPVGSNRWAPINARILLATNRDLIEACNEGRFRQDLFERIQGFSLRLPPLRERRADLLLLAQHFVDQYNQEYSCQKRVPEFGMDPLFRHDWPGNVRELRSTIRQASAYAQALNDPISTLHLLEAVQNRIRTASKDCVLRLDPTASTWQQVHDSMRASYFRSVLKLAGGKMDIAAKQAGVSRSRFYEIMKDIGDFESSERLERSDPAESTDKK